MRIRARIIVKNYEIEERRIKLGYTQVDFADACGLNISTYRDIESMKIKPSEEHANSIALELGESKDVLFPEGYERMVDVFKNSESSRVLDFVNPLLETESETLLLNQADAKFTVNKLLGAAHLPQKEYEVISLRYGLKNSEPKTLEEVAQEIGVTRERIRQIEAKAHERIRDAHRLLETKKKQL